VARKSKGPGQNGSASGARGYSRSHIHSHSHIALAMAMQISYLDLDGHLLGGRATKIKTKQRFPIKATTWPKGDWTLAAWAIRAP